MKKSFSRTISLGMSALLPVTALLVATPSQANIFSDLDVFSRRYRQGQFTEEFAECATQLLGVGVREDQAAIACSEALEPTDVSQCVSSIDTGTVINELYALFACFRVRRPLELAECVVTINDNVLVTRTELAGNITVAATELEPLALSTLDHCRRSLLPTRLSACVVGLSQQIPLTPSRALNTCIDAEDFPRELYTPSTNATLEPDYPTDANPIDKPSFEEFSPLDEKFDSTTPFPSEGDSQNTP
ncbi:MULTISPECIES: hypothetical protein [Spirulina sp. CCY15215]|uniref:hypothetical protein n=1 Tax=Spirulina sp. CCY15215 TaxID=2767591 RepID=UPI001951FCA7|nr:hypothetical protein [Spirulina major]